MKYFLVFFAVVVSLLQGASQIYPADAPGITMEVKQDQLGEREDWVGYLTVSELRVLMMKDPDNCVGLRVYDLEIKPSSKIIVTPVDANGSELGTKSYFINHVPDNNGETGEFVSRATAKTIALQNLNNSEKQFVSFFSLEMLEQLIEQGATGVAFFRITQKLNVELSESDLEVTKSIPSEFLTHIAFPAEKKDGTISIVKREGLISDMPCPGHCADLGDQKDLSTLKSTTSVHGFMTDGIYLIQW